MSELGRCWSTWESSVASTSAALHRCDLNFGHPDMHRTGGMQWSHGVSMLSDEPIRADDPVSAPITPSGDTTP